MNKPVNLLLLVLILVVGIVNLLASFGLFGGGSGGGGNHQYRVVTWQQMDSEGFGDCSNHGECEAVCPKQISIEHIAVMRREFFKAMVKGG